MTQVTETLISALLTAIKPGLIAEAGDPVPGKMCVESAVSYALGEAHSDIPSCVGLAVRSFVIGLNDADWSSPVARSAGLERLAIAQLGTDELNERRFVSGLVKLVIGKWLPPVLRAAALGADVPYRAALLKAAKRCEAKPGISSARAACAAVDCAYPCFAYCVTTDAMSAATTGCPTYAAMVACQAAIALHPAYAKAGRDEVLSAAAEDVVQLLISMETPGGKFLQLREQQ